MRSSYSYRRDMRRAISGNAVCAMRRSVHNVVRLLLLRLGASGGLCGGGGPLLGERVQLAVELVRRAAGRAASRVHVVGEPQHAIAVRTPEARAVEGHALRRHALRQQHLLAAEAALVALAAVAYKRAFEQ